jgi:hypothetical protein
MSLTQFKGLDIHSYKFVDYRSKINILSIQAKKFDVP